MPPLNRRYGTSLAELIVTLALAAVVLAASARALTQQLRQRHDREVQRQADVALRDVQAALRGVLSHAAAVRAVGDTALDVASLGLVARPCDATGARLVVAASNEWWSPPHAGDSVALIDTLTRLEWRSVIVSTGSQRPSARCAAGGTRLTLAAPPPPTVPALALPMRIWRPLRYVAYRAGDGTWWLGERNCSPTCGAAQPVAGPLLPLARGGLRLSPFADRDGRLVAIDAEVAAPAGTGEVRRTARLLVAPLP